MFWNRKKKTTEIAVAQPKPRQKRERLSEDSILKAFDMLGITADLDTAQKQLFVAVAHQMQLNPLKREIHAISIWNSRAGKEVLTPVVGYQVYIKRAEESGRLEYWRIEEAGEVDHRSVPNSDYKVTLVVKRKDRPDEFRWSCRYAECVMLMESGPNSMWRKRPYFMTQKCAIGQGFRLAFPDVLLDMPYVDAEIDDGGQPADEPVTIAEPQPIAGISVDTEGKVVATEAEQAALDAKQEEELKFPKEELKAAKEELQAVYHLIKRPVGPDQVVLYSKKEIDAKIAEAKAAADDIEKLRLLAVAWSEDFAERGENHAFDKERV